MHTLPPLYIRCDGGTHIGMGHVVRCLALAQMVRSYFDVHFIVQETDASIYALIASNGFAYSTIARTSNESEDVEATLHGMQQREGIIVLDGYHFRTLFQQQLREHGFKVVAIDDLHAWHYTADAIINHAPGIGSEVYDTAPHTRLLLGLKYALLRPEVIAATQRNHTIRNAEHVLISMGAADADNCTQFFASLLRNHFPEITAHLLVSDLNPHLTALKSLASAHPNRVVLHNNLSGNALVELLLTMDAVICPASSISLEACATGCTLITGFTADNQLGILSGLEHRRAAFSLGKLQTLEEFETAKHIGDWLNNLHTRTEQQQQQRLLIDGRSGLRIACALMEVAQGVTVRLATPSDAQRYFDWANDADVRANSYSTEPIAWENHLHWFQQTLASTQHRLYIYCIDSLPAAQLRLKLEEQTATISYSVDAAHRGRGLGKFMLRHITAQAALDFPSLHALTGWVKKTNTPSVRAFEACGYSASETTDDSIRFSFLLGQR